MAKRNWETDGKLRRIDTSINQSTFSIMDLANGCGKVVYSPSQRQFMNPSRARRIDPNSPEGQAIISKYSQRTENKQ